MRSSRESENLRRPEKTFVSCLTSLRRDIGFECSGKAALRRRAGLSKKAYREELIIFCCSDFMKCNTRCVLVASGNC